MDCVFVCLSDIHVSTRNKNEILKKLDKVVEKSRVIKSKNSKSNVIFLIPGDVAFSGKKEEYDLVKKVFEQFKEIGSVVLVPGNHDHDFSFYKDELREDLLAVYRTKEISESFFDIATKGQSDFFSFKEIVGRKEELNKFNIYSEHHLEKVRVSCLNTAWCSKLKESSGELYYPESFIEKKQKQKLNISIFHHPLSWFEANNSKRLRNKLFENYDIIITGHEHLADSLKISKSSNSCTLIETMPLDDRHSVENGFIYFYLENEKLVVSKCIWEGDSFKDSKVISETDSVSGAKRTDILKVDFLNELNDVGANVRHPSKELLSLDDIFIYPNISIKENSRRNISNISSVSLIKVVSDENKNVLLYGEESSGKTTLLRKMYIDLVNLGFLPVLLDVSTYPKIKNVNKFSLEREIKKQYRIESLEEFISKKSSKFLLLDNIDQCKGEQKDFSEFFCFINGIFKSTLITASDAFEFSQASINPITELDDFTQYDIQRFGYKLRYQIIEKWNLLDENLRCNRQELLYANHRINDLIEKVLGKGVIPSLPLFLVTMLQSSQTGLVTDANTSTYGFYYQYLVTTALGTSGVRKEQLDEYFQYLTELSYLYFKRDVKSITLNELEQFNFWMSKEYGIKIDNNERLSKLKRANIIGIYDQSASFKYPYIFYFFIARYFSINLDSCSGYIDKLVEKLYVKKNMNILMFLTHHSRSDFVLDKIIKKSESLLEKISPSNLENEVNFIQEIMKSEPILEYKSELSDPNEFRKSLAEQKDNSEAKKGSKKYEDDSSHAEETPDVISDIMSAFSACELLAQLAKNYYGSMRSSQKERLIKEAIEAPLRSLESILRFFREDSERLVAYVRKNIEKKYNPNHVMTESNIDEVARESIFNVIVALCFTVISKASFSISDSNLEPIIRSVCDSEGTNAKRLINFVSKLETGVPVNLDELSAIKNSFSKNMLASTILKGFILRYLYMFEVRESKVKEICTRCGINFKGISTKVGFEKLKRIKN